MCINRSWAILAVGEKSELLIRRQSGRQQAEGNDCTDTAQRWAVSFRRRSQLMPVTPSICEQRLSFQKSTKHAVTLLTVADTEVCIFEGLPDRHSWEAPGRCVQRTNRLTPAAGRPRAWPLKSNMSSHACKRGRTRKEINKLVKIPQIAATSDSFLLVRCRAQLTYRGNECVVAADGNNRHKTLWPGLH